MDKKFYYISGILSFVLLILIIWVVVLLVKPTKPDSNLQLTNFSIVVENGNYNVYSIEDGNETVLAPQQYLPFIEPSFNSPKDLLWISCTNQLNTTILSPENINIIDDPILGKGFEISSTDKLKINVKCEKAS